MLLSKNASVDVVCWDWNGTLLDDVDLALAAMNTVLWERQLATIPDRDVYRRVFGFPIRSFYARLGLEQVLISATPEAIPEQQLAPHALDAHFSQIGHQHSPDHRRHPVVDHLRDVVDYLGPRGESSNGGVVLRP